MTHMEREYEIVMLKFLLDVHSDGSFCRKYWLMYMASHLQRVIMSQYYELQRDNQMAGEMMQKLSVSLNNMQ